MHDDPILADGVLRYLGQPVFAVIATSRDAARRAAALAKQVLEIEPLPAVLNPLDNPLLSFEPAYTSFNTVPDNNGAQSIPPGTFTGVNQAGALKCAPCGPCLTIAADRIR